MGFIYHILSNRRIVGPNFLILSQYFTQLKKDFRSSPYYHHRYYSVSICHFSILSVYFQFVLHLTFNTSGYSSFLLILLKGLSLIFFSILKYTKKSFLLLYSLSVNLFALFCLCYVLPHATSTKKYFSLIVVPG